MKYPKIKTVYKRDPSTNYKTLLEGEFAQPEFEYLVDNTWVWTEKVDGMNIRVIWDGYVLIIAGRTDRAQIPRPLRDKLWEMFTVEMFSSQYPNTPMILYGEGYGARIQKGGGNYISDGVDFILFDVMVGDVWLERENIVDIAGCMGIDMVPIIGFGSLYAAVETARKGPVSRIGSQRMEGLVMRPAWGLADRRGQRIITKIKYKDFRS